MLLTLGKAGIMRKVVAVLAASTVVLGVGVASAESAPRTAPNMESVVPVCRPTSSGIRCSETAPGVAGGNGFLTVGSAAGSEVLTGAMSGQINHVASGVLAGRYQQNANGYRGYLSGSLNGQSGALGGDIQRSANGYRGGLSSSFSPVGSGYLAGSLQQTSASSGDGQLCGAFASPSQTLTRGGVAGSSDGTGIRAAIGGNLGGVVVDTHNKAPITATSTGPCP
jgi:hypothetical protein